MSDDTDDFADKARVSVAEAIFKLTGAAPSEADVDAKAARITKTSLAVGRTRRTGTIHLKH